MADLVRLPGPESPPTAPSTLSAEAVPVWQEVLEAGHVISPAHRDVLACYCEAVVTHRRASALLANSQVLIRNPQGSLVRNPAVSVQQDAAATVRALARELGIMSAAPEPPEAASERPVLELVAEEFRRRVSSS